MTTEDRVATHLYVAVNTSNQYLAVERFRLRGGIPEKQPDFTLNGYTGFLAVAGDGTLYVDSQSFNTTIYAFPPNSDMPSREIQIPNPIPGCKGLTSFTAVTAIAADKAGYLFVGINTYDSPHPSEHYAVTSANLNLPCDGVAIFAPSGSQPVQTIRLAGEHGEIKGLAVDSRDNLFIAKYPNIVAEYSNAATQPVRTRLFRNRYIHQVQSVATGPTGDVYIASISDYSAGWIDRYTRIAKGSGPPTSTVTLAASGLHFLYSIAAFRRYLYVDDTFNSVDLYYSHENGSQYPFMSIPASEVVSVAVGP